MGSFGPDQVVKEHFDRLTSGVKNWNAWRANSPDVVPGLGGLPLGGLNLCGANLRGAFLFGADLSGCDLTDCDLGHADLQAANLIDARVQRSKLNSSNLKVSKLTNLDLRSASLNGANFQGASMEGVNLEGQTLRACDIRGAKMVQANLRNANLRKAQLSRADLRNADLSGADLTEADMRETKLDGSKLLGASVSLTDLGRATLNSACLDGANIRRSNLTDTNLKDATLRSAFLNGSTLVRTDLTGADLSGCSVHGISVWDICTEGAKQNNLRITPEKEASITVDDIEVAQFIYLLLNNKKIRNVIDTITSKAVLILGRFTAPRKLILDMLANELRHRNFLPIVFDFEKPDSRDLTETIQTLASISKMVIADLTDAKSIPQELSFIVPNFPSLPVQPILSESADPYAMFEHFKRYPWVRKTWVYSEEKPRFDQLMASIESGAPTHASYL